MKLLNMLNAVFEQHSYDKSFYYIHCESKKTIHVTFDHNIGKCTLIYKIL